MGIKKAAELLLKIKHAELKGRVAKRRMRRAMHGERTQELVHKRNVTFQHCQRQSRRWLHAQTQSPGHPISNFDRQQLFKLFCFTENGMKQRIKANRGKPLLGKSAQAHWDRLEDQRAAVAAHIAAEEGVDIEELESVPDWWENQETVRKREKLATELANLAEKKTRKQKDFERRKEFLNKKAREATAAGGDWVSETVKAPMDVDEEDEMDVMDMAPEPRSPR